MIIGYPYKWCIMDVMIMNHFLTLPTAMFNFLVTILWCSAIFRRNIYHNNVPYWYYSKNTVILLYIYTSVLLVLFFYYVKYLYIESVSHCAIREKR